MAKIPVGILGATGIVGQRFVQLLAEHPWFEITAVAASDRSVGRAYAEICHWLLPTPMPAAVAALPVQPVAPPLDCQLIFSALPASAAQEAEAAFARAGYGVCSNASAHRMAADVPLLIPEVNPEHLALIPAQRRRWGSAGYIVTSANCSTTQLALALKPLDDAFGVRGVAVVTLQAASGAGYPGFPALDLLDNVVPYIAGEEEKLAQEPRKLLGTLTGDRIAEAAFAVSAQCNRVPVREGHTECVSVTFARPASPEAVSAVLREFRPSAAAAQLPSAVARPIVVHTAPERPQPLLDRETGAGMVVGVGRVRACPLFDVKFVLLGHNTVRGAAGGAIHNAELLVAQGWLEEVRP